MNHIVNGGSKVDQSSWLPPSTPEARLAEMQMSLWAIRDAISQMARNIELLLEDRTRPAEPRKYPTEETVQLRLEEEDVKNVAEALDDHEKGIGQRKRRQPRWVLLQKDIERCGGEKLFKRKYEAGLVRIICTAFRHGSAYYLRGCYARVDIVDSTLPKTASGADKKFGIECYTEREYLALLDTLSNILATDLRSRYA